MTRKHSARKEKNEKFNDCRRELYSPNLSHVRPGTRVNSQYLTSGHRLGEPSNWHQMTHGSMIAPVPRMSQGFNYARFDGRLMMSIAGIILEVREYGV